MASKSAYSVAANLLLILGAKAQVAVWGQCGGIGYTGSTTCDAGAICTKQNDWYSQCLPGTGASSTLATSISTVKPSSTTSSGSSQTSSAASVKYFITFGDSYSQTGFDISGTKPSASNPLGNPPLPGWTSSGGLNWIGYLVSKYNTSTLLSYNFAYGGATTDATLVTPYAPTVLSFIDQVTQFSNSLASHPSYAPWTGANTLVGVWMGVNDVGNSYYKSNVSDINTAIMDRYFAQLQILYNAGARNFVLLNVPPIQKTPAMLAQSADAQALEATIITQYNNLVSSRLASFLSANSGSKGWVVDTQAPFNTAISNPTAYGAKDATCYSEVGTSCLWFNDYHPGIAIQELVAKAVAAALKGVFF